MGFYVSPVRKSGAKITFSVGRNDQRKKFHIVFKVQGAEVSGLHVPGKMEGMGFDFACGIKAETIKKVYEEVQDLLAKGYQEEELSGPPPGI